MKNQKGFSALEGLLILVIVSLIGFVGWYVFHTKASVNNTYKSAVQTSGAVLPKSSANTTFDWVSYSSEADKYSFKYPKTWVKKDCGGPAIYLAADQKHLAACNSGYVGQMIVGVDDGDTRTDNNPDSGNVSCTTEKVTVDQVDGRKFVCTVSKDFPNDTGATESTDYLFYSSANDKTYDLTYLTIPGAPDAQNDFNTLVTQTLLFHP